MSITIEINKKHLDNKEIKSTLHFLPATIRGDGEAKVEKFFNVYTLKENGFLTNSLRGYPLQGEQLPVPKKYKGVVLLETSKPLNDDTDRLLRIKGTFDEFTYWNYDKIPSASDGYKQVLEFLNIAEVLANPIPESDVLSELNGDG